MHRITQPSPYMYMFWGALAFAFMGAFSHLAGEQCDWQFVAVARTLVAFLISLIIAYFSKVKLIFWAPKPLWIRSISGSIGIICCFYAYTHLPLSDASTLINTAAIWVTLLNWWVFQQKPANSTWGAILMAVTGMVLIQQPHFSSGKLACFIALLNAFFTAISMLGLNQLQNVDPRAVVTHFSGVSSVISLIFLMVATPQIHWPQLANPKALVWLFMVGVTGVIGQMGMTMAFTRGNVSRVSVVGLSQIIFGLGLDLLIWHRHVSLISLIGIMLAASPTAWLMLTRESNQPPQAPPPEDLLANNKLTLPTP